MRPTLRRLHSPDAPQGLATFEPEHPEHFGLLVQAMVGRSDDPRGEESFDFVVCSPSWLASQLAHSAPEWLRHRLVMNRWDHPALVRLVEDVCRCSTGET